MCTVNKNAEPKDPALYRPNADLGSSIIARTGTVESVSTCLGQCTPGTECKSRLEADAITDQVAA